MTINFEYIVIAGSLVVSVSGFIVTAAIMLRSNKNGFVALKGDIDAIGEMFKIEKENAIVEQAKLEIPETSLVSPQNASPKPKVLIPKLKLPRKEEEEEIIEEQI